MRDIKECKGWSNLNTAGRELALYKANVDSIPSTTYGPLKLSAVISEHRAKRKPRALSGVAQEL